MSLSLTSEERRAAHELWQELMFAPSKSELDTARAHLRSASPAIQDAVMRAIAQMWTKEKKEIEWDNPFE